MRNPIKHLTPNPWAGGDTLSLEYPHAFMHHFSAELDCIYCGRTIRDHQAHPTLCPSWQTQQQRSLLRTLRKMTGNEKPWLTASVMVGYDPDKQLWSSENGFTGESLDESKNISMVEAIPLKSLENKVLFVCLAKDVVHSHPSGACTIPGTIQVEFNELLAEERPLPLVFGRPDGRMLLGSHPF